MSNFTFDLMKIYYLTMTKERDGIPSTLMLITSDFERDIYKYWYWRYDPLRLMPLLLALTRIIVMIISFPFVVIGATCNLGRYLCALIIEKLETLGDNYTVFDDKIVCEDATKLVKIKQ